MASSSSSVPNMPRVTTDAEALPLLKSDMARLCEDVLSIIRDEVFESDLDVESIRISLKNSPEEDRDELVFRVNVTSEADDALALWDSIGEAMSNLRPSHPFQSENSSSLLDEKIGIFVEW